MRGARAARRLPHFVLSGKIAAHAKRRFKQATDDNLRAVGGYDDTDRRIRSDHWQQICTGTTEKLNWSKHDKTMLQFQCGSTNSSKCDPKPMLSTLENYRQNGTGPFDNRGTRRGQIARYRYRICGTCGDNRHEPVRRRCPLRGMIACR
jgi:hypothetical protein